MELKESIEFINRKLVDEFGVDTIKNIPIWRVVWSEDQIVKQLGTFNDYTASRVFIREVREVREIKKYPHIKEKYLLERLILVPDEQQILEDKQVSYECIWVFQTDKQEYLPPQWQVSKFIIDVVYAAQGKKSLSNYINEFRNEGEERAATEKRITEFMQQIFGNETAVTDSLSRKLGVTDFNPKVDFSIRPDFDPKSN